MEQSGALGEMASHQGWPPFRLTHCMTEGQITPPSSPTLLPARNRVRLQLSKLLQRSRSVQSKNGGAPDKYRSMSTRPSVAEMKAPFPLLLPHSPSVSEEDSPAPGCLSGLRRMPTSYNDLRGLAQQQGGSPITPLLPSPITGELEDEGRSYFKFHNPRSHSRTSNNGSIDNLQILSYYCSNEKSDSEGEQHSLHWPAVDDSHDLEESTASESSPATPIDQEFRDVLCADESGWLANTTSHQERRRRFKARFYQVVEHPCIDLQDGQREDQVVSLSRRSGLP